ncbi:S41 family peptidase [Steroidobacter sp. S1-65]|uniref:S41 family peptidase n=1 Tax=Steroidobacter gossypii TaxID=2805490 RepID=A0ABS1WWU6_9GAMM|nr:S41 family peptidase [Steroidobacter gossypii]MBM0105449.1 S41 family peptidase [Steroidobacter gossypii]
MPAMLPTRLRVASATLSLFCMSMFGASQAATPPEHEAALQAIIAAFEEQYVFPEMRPRIAQHLKEAERSGRYDTQDAAEFAERVTADLQQVSGDKHLWLSVDPAGYAAAMETDNDDERVQAMWQRLALREHHGLTEMKVLGGNVRYLRISRFDWLNDQSGAAYDRAMSFLKDGDAVIIDLRGNGGGSHSAVRHLVSHFMDGDVLEMTFLEGSKPPVQSRTHEHLPAGRLKGMPLYVLIDLSSASAAEAFAYDVQQFKLGELVGGKTVGAANNNTLLPVAPNFILSISYGRPVHPVSNTNWEGVGVTPSVAADPAQALEVAHSLALKRLSERDGVSEENLLEYTWARAAVEASLHPVTFTKDRLQRLAGSYGSYKVEFRDGTLWLIRRDRAPARLSPMTADGLFAVERINGVRVKLTGKTMEVFRPGQPQPQVLPRA